MSNEFNAIFLLIKYVNKQNDILLEKELKDLSVWVHDLIEIMGEFEGEISTLDIDNVCNSAIFLFTGRSVFIDYQICFHYLRKLIEKIIGHYNQGKIIHMKNSSICKNLSNRNTNSVLTIFDKFFLKIKEINQIYIESPRIPP